MELGLYFFNNSLTLSVKHLAVAPFLALKANYFYLVCYPNLNTMEIMINNVLYSYIVFCDQQ